MTFASRNTVITVCLSIQMISICMVESQISTNVTIPGYNKWSPSWSVRDDLYCPTDCATDAHPDRCCSCNSKPCWQINPAQCDVVIGQLFVENIDIYGTALVVNGRIKNATVYELVHSSGRLTSVPANICKWANKLVTVDFRKNRINTIGELRCLTMLDTLMLDENKITHIENDTFTNMMFLRILTLSKNLIENLDPNTIQIKHGNIFLTDFSYNEITNVDVTNIIRPGPFCSVSYEGCNITRQSNLLNFQLKEGVMHGPGDINFNHTMGYLPMNFTSLGLNDYSMLAKYFEGHMYMDESAIKCDCNLYPLFMGLGKNISRFWPNLGVSVSFICISPERMKGKNLTSILLSGEFVELTCDIIVNCPAKCLCLDNPSHGRVIVNCSGAGLTKMPSDLPIGLWNNIKLDIYVDDNYITRFEDRNYIDRVAYVDFTGNRIDYVSSNIAAKVNDIHINISDHQLTMLPRSFQLLDPNVIRFGINPIPCNCDNLWIGDWIRIHNSQGRLYCSVRDEVFAAEMLTAEYLSCKKEDTNYVTVFSGIAALAVISSLMFISVLLYYFRFEIMLLKRKLVNKHECNNEEGYDVFLSYCEDNESIVDWIDHDIKPSLDRAGYSMFIPWFSMPYGSQQEETLTTAIAQSKNYTIFLCDKYFNDPNTILEFESIWSNFAADATKKIIVVNFNSLVSTQIKDMRLRAFVRIWDDLDFSITESKLIERLKKRLGPPRVLNKAKYDSDNREYVSDGGDEGKSTLFQTNDKFDNQGLPKTESGESDNHISDKVTVFERLNIRKTICNCKYRKCYLHTDAYNRNTLNIPLRQRGSSAAAASHRRRKAPSSSIRDKTQESVGEHDDIIHHPCTAKILEDIELDI